MTLRKGKSIRQIEGKGLQSRGSAQLGQWLLHLQWGVSQHEFVISYSNDCQLESENKQLSLYEGLGEKLWHEEEILKTLGRLEKVKLK